MLQYMIGGVLTGLALGSAGCSGKLKKCDSEDYRYCPEEKVSPHNESYLGQVKIVKYEF